MNFDVAFSTWFQLLLLQPLLVLNIAKLFLNTIISWNIHYRAPLKGELSAEKNASLCWKLCITRCFFHSERCSDRNSFFILIRRSVHCTIACHNHHHQCCLPCTHATRERTNVRFVPQQQKPNWLSREDVSASIFFNLYNFFFPSFFSFSAVDVDAAALRSIINETCLTGLFFFSPIWFSWCFHSITIMGSVKFLWLALLSILEWKLLFLHIIISNIVSLVDIKVVNKNKQTRIASGVQVCL